MSRIALVVGGSGLVGGRCLDHLLRTPDYTQVVALVRRPLPLADPRLEQRVTDFDRLGAVGIEFPVADHVFCCLGTTMHKAGSRAAFRQVDFTYVVAVAAQALAAGATQFLLVSSVGANPHSPVFYSRIKGEAEEAVVRLPFAGRHIFRPSILVGERAEVRPGERVGLAVAGALTFAFRGPLRRYRPIAADDVARAMVRVARGGRTGVYRYESEEISRLARA